MAERSRFFNSYASDVREYSSGDFAEVFKRFLANGVIRDVANELAVSAGAGVSVNVATGEGMVEGYWYQNDAVKNVALATPDATYDRIDRIVLRLDLSSPVRLVTVEDLTGIPAANPTPPALTQDGTTWEESLAQVRVAASTGALTVTDERTYATPSLPIAGNPVGTTDTQTLTNKDLSDPSNIFPPFVPRMVSTSDSPYTVPGWNYHVDVDASGGPVTVLLPTAVGNAGALIEVRKKDSSANAVTIDASGSETINDEANLVIYNQYTSYSLRSDGSNVEII